MDIFKGGIIIECVFYMVAIVKNAKIVRSLFKKERTVRFSLK